MSLGRCYTHYNQANKNVRFRKEVMQCAEGGDTDRLQVLLCWRDLVDADESSVEQEKAS